MPRFERAWLLARHLRSLNEKKWLQWRGPSDMNEPMSWPPRYIAVTGAVGVGKTTFARSLAGALGGAAICEAFETNPFQREGAFETVFWFVLLHLDQLKAGVGGCDAPPVVSDFFLPHDRYFALAELDRADLRAYDALLVRAVAKAPEPDLVIFLHAPWKICEAHIARRGRAWELADGRTLLRKVHRHFSDLWKRRPPSRTFLKIDWRPSSLEEARTLAGALTAEWLRRREKRRRSAR